MTEDYECVCPECGRIWENGFCYECGIRLDTQTVKNHKLAIQQEKEDEWLYGYNNDEDEDEDYDDLWEDALTDGDIEYYYNRYSK